MFESVNLIYLFVILYRIFNSLVVKSFFSPDEYWQSIEIAHKLTYKYTLTIFFNSLALDLKLGNGNMV